MLTNIHNLDNYDYELEKKYISSYPIEKRADSKLLVYKNKKIIDSNFKQISNYLPKDSTLFFNDSKVINGRLYFKNKNGAKIEILIADEKISSALRKKSPLLLKVLIGNKKKWKGDDILENKINGNTIKIKKIKNKVSFEWDNDISFDELLLKSGIIPLPPYINRDTESSDYLNYQTVYSKNKGSIAAPTAGLHFNNDLMNNLKRNQKVDFFTLHVGLGTFKPIKSENIQKHDMHSEEIIINRENILNIYNSKNITAVGTTSLRVLESIYYLGLIIENNKCNYEISQEIIKKKIRLNLKESCKKIIDYFNFNNINKLKFNSKIFIYPGYSFKACDQLITNFHYPKSSLIILIASFIGKDWREVYKFAKEKNYRFLSYGDSSLLYRK